jgi:DnaD/phage-associated family protein
MFSVEWEEIPHFTAVPDSFITKYMPQAPAEYVKIFIYLLMLAHKKSGEPQNPDLCSVFNISKIELDSALKYWENKKLLELYYRSGEITGVKIRLNVSEQVKDSHRLNQSRVRSLMTDGSDAQTLCFVAEQYLSRPLTSTEVGTLLYFLDELKFPLDLCEYLVEYCVSRGHTNIHYIEKVGLTWHKNGYKTAEEAKENSSSWSKIHFDVLKAFGIGGRNPIKKEIEYIDKWYKTYCFSLDIITEACSITLSKTGKQSFEYADTILKSWRDSGVRSLKDIENLEKEFKLKKKQPANSKNTNKNQFLNYQQRSDDLYELERQLDRQFAEMTEDQNGTD